ncbi:MAG: GNAT family N-acetyltransferase [Gemmatimonadota bacterium]|nr:GNAT family N-acetyltransferase [Gemmatimonadota bacterium]
MPTDPELMQMHVEALFVHNADGDIVRVNEPTGARAPHFFLGGFANGKILRFRDDVNAAIRQQLTAVAAREDTAEWPCTPIDATPYQAVLLRHGPIANTSTGPAFCFSAPSSRDEDLHRLPHNMQTTPMNANNARLLHPLLAEWLGDTTLCEPMIALVVDEQAVSLCCSVRRTALAHEAGIETAAAHCGHGYGSRVAQSWAQAVHEMNRVALYSTSWNNTLSRAVARKLGLHHFGSDLHIS